MDVQCTPGARLLAVIASLSLVCHAQTELASYNVTVNSNIAENNYAARSGSVPSGFSASALTLNGGVGAGPTAGHYHTTNWDATLNTSKYIQFTITPPAGGVEFLSLELNLHRFLGAPSPRTTVAVRSSVDGFAANIASASEATQDGTSLQMLDLTGIARQTSAVTFRIYFFGDSEGGWQGSGAPGGSQNVGMRLLSVIPPAPVISGVTDDSGRSGSDGVTNDTTLSVEGTALAGNTIEVFLNGGSLGTTVAAGDGSWSFDHTGTTLAEGSYALTATATNALAKKSALSSSFNLVVDTTLPSAPSITGYAPDTGVSASDRITNAQMLTVSGTTDALAEVTVFDGMTSLGTATANGSGAWSFMTGALSEGTHTFSAAATDLAGNKGPQSAGQDVIVDRTAPAAPSVDSISDDTGSSNNDALTFDRILSFSGMTEANAGVEVFLGGALIGTTTADGAGAWTFAHPATLAEGMHDVSARATDVAGNRGMTGSALTVTVDLTVPAGPSVDGVSDDTGRSSSDAITGDNTLSFMGMTEAGALVEVFIGGSSIGTVTANGSGVWTFDHSGTTLADGSYAITAKATDVAGNPGSAGSALMVTVDTKAPAAPSIPDLEAASDSGSFDDDDLTNVTMPSFSGTCEALAIVALASDLQGSLTPAFTSGSGGTWNITLTTMLNDGTHMLTATAEDVAGNISAASTLSLEIDTVTAAPTFAFDRNTNLPTDMRTFDRTLKYFGMAEVAAAFELTRDMQSIGTGTVDGTGLWEVDDMATLLDARTTYNYEVSVTDVAGNTNQASFSIRITEYLDFDRDGLSLYEELVLGTKPLVRDTDMDGISDGLEVALGTDPTDTDDPVVGGDNPDRDFDGLPDSHDPDPDDPDSDDDGIYDGYEVQLNQSFDLSIPNALGDANGDGMIDFQDVRTILGVASRTITLPSNVSIADLDVNTDFRFDVGDAMVLLYWLRGVAEVIPLRSEFELMGGNR